MRKAFNFYISYWEVANELNDKDRLKFYDALLKKQFTGQDSELEGMAKFAFLSQKHSIDLQIDGFISQMNRKHPNQDPWQGGRVGGMVGATVTPSVQEKEKEKEKVKEKDKEISIEERKQKFAESLKIYIDKYSKEMLRDFYLYWTEHSLNNKKLKYELESTFSIPNRLNTWNKNRIKFGYVDSVIDKPSFNPYG